jgi:hypothetical protein
MSMARGTTLIARQPRPTRHDSAVLRSGMRWSHAMTCWDPDGRDVSSSTPTIRPTRAIPAGPLRRRATDQRRNWRGRRDLPIGRSRRRGRRLPWRDSLRYHQTARCHAEAAQRDAPRRRELESQDLTYRRSPDYIRLVSLPEDGLPQVNRGSAHLATIPPTHAGRPAEPPPTAPSRARRQT